MTAKQFNSGEKALTRDECERLLAACSTLEDRVMILLQVTLGLRRADLAAIQIASIDLDANQIAVPEQKNGGRARLIPIGDRLKQEIALLLATIDTTQQTTLFSIRGRQMYNRFTQVAKVAGVRPGETITVPALRATACQFMTDAGWRIEEIAEIIGDSIETLQRHYLVPSKARIMQTAREKEVIAGTAWGTRRER